MTKISYYFLMSLICTLAALSSCSTSEDNPKEPAATGTQITVNEDDSIAVRISSMMDIRQEEFSSRSGNSRDLIGVEINRKVSGFNPYRIYASGVFDDIDDIVFKFVKGGTYTISMTYFPNAKDIVYNYPNGTYGAPFSYEYGLKSYTLNKPVYYSGTEGGFSGDRGPELGHILSCIYQTTANGTLVQEMRRGTTPRYTGKTGDFTIDDDHTGITVKLELCLMAITLKPENFTEGKLTLVSSIAADKESSEWSVRPGDDMTWKIQIPYGSGSEGLQLFYTDAEGDKYLLATKEMEWKYATNLVFRFALSERADGSIGIQMPSDESFTDEEAAFDY
ncbi:MAG: hypothetical protein K2K93_02855 [Muribaculaceae bacterium]|nr:hypothetical protein [Muribaculaceae bacterium]